jgi:hypothetical protein
MGDTTELRARIQGAHRQLDSLERGLDLLDAITAWERQGAAPDADSPDPSLVVLEQRGQPGAECGGEIDADPRQRRCAFCARPFKVTNPSSQQKYCSVICKGDAWRARKGRQPPKAPKAKAKPNGVQRSAPAGVASPAPPDPEPVPARRNDPASFRFTQPPEPVHDPQLDRKLADLSKMPKANPGWGPRPEPPRVEG